MLWRHLLEDTLTSPPFVAQQLRFERDIYARIALCEAQEVMERHQYQQCAEEWEGRIERHGLMVQYLAREREKVDLE
jgi:hypothetical protein